MEYLRGIEIVILTRNRPDFLENAIKAIDVIAFTLPVHLVISNNAMSVLLTPLKTSKHWEIRERKSDLNPHEHFNRVVLEAKYEWTLITHDDDEILQNFADQFAVYNEREDVRFVSGLSRIKNLEYQPDAINWYHKRLFKAGITDSYEYKCKDFLKMQLQAGSVLPFSGVAVRTKVLHHFNTMQSVFGFAADYYFAMAICQPSRELPDLAIFDSKKPVINYFLHAGQDSANSRMKYELPILTEMCKFEILENNKVLQSRSAILKLMGNLAVGIRQARRVENSVLLKYVDERLKKSVLLNDFAKFLLLKIVPKMYGLELIVRFYSKIKSKSFR